MANLTNSSIPQFRHVQGIHNLEEENLNKLGYYKGYPCLHGHVIRDTKDHWCYECAKKILSNVCGFDINYLHGDYKHKFAKLWKKITIGPMDECWLIESPGGETPKRVCLPSYRAHYSKQKAENVNIHKAVYQCAWGDVGNMPVTRICANHKCANPLHMVSSWNRTLAPASVTPLDVEFRAEKLMLFTRQSQTETGIRPVIEREYRSVITNPEYVKYRRE
jgi:hypothetical protein